EREVTVDAHGRHNQWRRTTVGQFHRLDCAWSANLLFSEGETVAAETCFGIDDRCAQRQRLRTVRCAVVDSQDGRGIVVVGIGKEADSDLATLARCECRGAQT